MVLAPELDLRHVFLSARQKLREARRLASTSGSTPEASGSSVPVWPTFLTRVSTRRATADDVVATSGRAGLSTIRTPSSLNDDAV